jgi:hypothetical protein
MASPIDPGAGKTQADALGLPAGLKVASVFPFGGLNRADGRIGIEDTEFYWLENYVRVGKGRLRSSWDVGADLYKAPTGKTIVSFYWFNIGPESLCAVFLSDGTAVQVAFPSGAVTTIGTTIGQFYVAGSPLPACCPWGSQYLLISNNLTANSYWVWDGTLLYQAGGVSPLVTITSGGSGYTTAPAVTAFGGSGTGASFVATIANNTVVSVVPTSTGTGYGPADIVQLQFNGGGIPDSGAFLTAQITGGTIQNLLLLDGGSGFTTAPTVGFTGGGGTGATAVATVAGGKVTSLLLTDPGSGYTGSPTVVFSGGGGAGALAVAEVSAGAVTSVTVVNGGSGFIGTPTLVLSGGAGIGAEATAVLTGSVITSVSVTNGGSGYTSAPAVTVQTGINNAASATVALMPIGVSGAAIETFQSRAWLAHPFQSGTLPSGGTINISAPGSFVDFATSDGGLLFVNSDRFLRSQYTALRQSNGYLYSMGDSSVGVINNVQTAGNPPTTSFNALNVDPQTGTSWRDSCQDYSRTILFSNPFGVWGVYGGAVTKVSKKLDPIFESIVLPPIAGAVTPSAAVSEQFSQRLYLLLVTIMDPFLNAPRTVMLGWDETDWGVYSQSSALIYIGTQETESNPRAWGTEGTKLLPLFATASDKIAKTLQTKYFAGDTAFLLEQSYAIYVTARNRQAGQTALTFSSTTVDGIGQASPLNLPAWMEDEVPKQGGSFQMENPVSFPVGTNVPATFATGTDPPVGGSGLGLTMITSAPDFELQNLQFGYIDVVGLA